jgi:cellulose synthase/poly-beta-1,6-N-acetylglucosamine synthase-like glycosyltransferase
MDADSILLPDCIKKQVAYFNNSQVMCVAPIVAVYKPKSIWQRVQQIEYMLGIFIREAFASYNAMHITPGAFSAYRRTFFKKHGLFSVNNLTEDLEMSLRVQYHNYIVETSDAVVYTHSPKNFVSLLKQRRRWYSGLIHNLAHYSALFSRNYGALGLVVLPVALFAILFSIILTMYAVVSAVIDVKKQYVYLQSINFDFMSTLSFTKSTFERYIFESLSNPVVLFLIFFILLSLGYLLFAKTKIKEHSNIAIGLPLFMIFYAMLFAFWWSVSFVYAIFKKSVSWR